MLDTPYSGYWRLLSTTFIGPLPPFQTPFFFEPPQIRSQAIALLVIADEAVGRVGTARTGLKGAAGSLDRLWSARARQCFRVVVEGFLVSLVLHQHALFPFRK